MTKIPGKKYRGEWQGDSADLLGVIYSVRVDKANGRKFMKVNVGGPFFFLHRGWEVKSEKI